MAADREADRLARCGALLLETRAQLLVFAFHLDRDRSTGFLQRLLEMRAADRRAAKILPQGQQPRATDHIAEIGAGVTLRSPRDLFEVHVGGQGHIPGLDAQDVQPAAWSGTGT